MKSNENHYKSKSLAVRYGNKSPAPHNDKPRSKTDPSKTRSSKTAGDEMKAESSQNKMSVAHQVKEMIGQSSTVYDCKLDDKQDDSKQGHHEEAAETPGAESKTIAISRYPLNAKNYIAELHKALIKECNFSLVDFNSLNATLDFDTLSNVSFRTMKAVKVRPGPLNVFFFSWPFKKKNIYIQPSSTPLPFRTT